MIVASILCAFSPNDWFVCLFFLLGQLLLCSSAAILLQTCLKDDGIVISPRVLLLSQQVLLSVLVSIPYAFTLSVSMFVMLVSVFSRDSTDAATTRDGGFKEAVIVSPLSLTL